MLSNGQRTTMKIYKADSFEYLRTIPRDSCDLIVTDPPYDLNESDKKYLHARFRYICKGAVIVFSPPENQWILPADQYLFWIKPISTKNTTKSYGRFVEMIFIYGKGTWNADRHWSQRNNVFYDRVDDSSLHPFRKPPTLIETLILNHSKPDDLVLDPFAGSGVVGEICDRHERRYLMIDKETGTIPLAK